MAVETENLHRNVGRAWRLAVSCTTEMRPVGEPFTVRMLLNHTSGLRDVQGLFGLMGRPSYSSMHTHAEVLEVMSRQRQLNFAPGTEYLYCNSTYILAALIVERASGQGFAAFCDEHLFRPREMTRTRWRDDFARVVAGRATAYERTPGGEFKIAMPYSNVVGNGGLLTTVGDLLKWTASFERATGEWAHVVQALQTPATLSNGRVLDYGLGLSLRATRGVRELSHSGSTAGSRAHLTHYPDHGVSIALLANHAGVNLSALSRAIAELVLDLPPAQRPAPTTLDAETLARHTGLFHSAQTDAVLSFSARDGALVYGGTELVPTGPGTFTASTGGMVFTFGEPDGNGQPQRLTVDSGGTTTSFSAVPRARPTGAQLAAYSGEYYSPELAVAHALAVRQGRLTVTGWPSPPVTAEPTFADGFWLGRA